MKLTLEQRKGKVSEIGISMFNNFSCSNKFPESIGKICGKDLVEFDSQKVGSFLKLLYFYQCFRKFMLYRCLCALQILGRITNNLHGEEWDDLFKKRMLEMTENKLKSLKW